MNKTNFSYIPDDSWEIINSFLEFCCFRKLIANFPKQLKSKSEDIIRIYCENVKSLDFIHNNYNCVHSSNFQNLPEKTKFQIIDKCSKLTNLVIEMQGETKSSLYPEDVQCGKQKIWYIHQFKNPHFLEKLNSLEFLKSITLRVPHVKYLEYKSIGYPCYFKSLYPYKDIMKLIAQLEKNNPDIQKIDYLLNNKDFDDLGYNLRFIWIKKKIGEDYDSLQQRVKNISDNVTFDNLKIEPFKIVDQSNYINNETELLHNDLDKKEVPFSSSLDIGYFGKFIYHSQNIKTCLYSNGVLIIFSRVFK